MKQPEDRIQKLLRYSREFEREAELLLLQNTNAVYLSNVLNVNIHLN